MKDVNRISLIGQVVFLVGIMFLFSMHFKLLGAPESLGLPAGLFVTAGFLTMIMARLTKVVLNKK